MTYPWFAVRVRTKGESAVETLLSAKSYETFLPTYLETKHYSDRIKRIHAALFPGYLFCRFDPDRRLPVLTTPGVHDIVSFNEYPEPVDESELDAVRRLIGANGLARPWPYLKRGDRVRIAVGSFSGVEGFLTSERGVDRLVVSVTLLQRSVAVEIDRTWVRPA